MQRPKQDVEKCAISQNINTERSRKKAHHIMQLNINNLEKVWYKLEREGLKKTFKQVINLD